MSSVRPSVCDVGGSGSLTNFGKSSRVANTSDARQDSRNFSGHPYNIYWAQRAVVFAIAQLSCFTVSTLNQNNVQTSTLLRLKMHVKGSYNTIITLYGLLVCCITQ